MLDRLRGTSAAPGGGACSHGQECNTHSDPSPHSQHAGCAVGNHPRPPPRGFG